MGVNQELFRTCHTREGFRSCITGNTPRKQEALFLGLALNLWGFLRDCQWFSSSRNEQGGAWINTGKAWKKRWRKHGESMEKLGVHVLRKHDIKVW